MVKLCNSNLCTVCHACVQQCPKKCISFIPDTNGFIEPKIDTNSCIECNRCVSVCHVLNSYHREKEVDSEVYAAWSKSRYNLSTSSSGGVFAELASSVLRDNGVVYAVGWSDKLTLQHIRINDVEDLYLVKGSKYLQSDMNGVYYRIKRDLQNGTYVFFCGTPCQVSGLLIFVSKYKNIDKSKLLTCDFICHGVPTQAMFKHYLKRMKYDYNKISNVDFRYLEGWGKQMKIFKKTGKSKVISVRNDFYMRMFDKSYIMDEACFSCKYSENTYQSDITLGDFWGIEKHKVYPHILRKGVSLVIPNTVKARSLILNLTSENRITIIKEAVEKVRQNNYNYTYNTKKPTDRDEFLKDFFHPNLSNGLLLRKYNLKASFSDYKTILRRYIFKLIGR